MNPVLRPRLAALLVLLLASSSHGVTPAHGDMARSSSPGVTLETSVCARLIAGAADSSLQSWQREFMLDAARERAAAPAPPGVLSDDGEWSQLIAPTRGHAGTIYDPLRDRFLLFGGNDGTAYNDTWSLSLGATPEWTRIRTVGDVPPARYNCSAIYDPVRDRMIVFGGEPDGYRNDAWALSLSGTPAWTELLPSGDLPRGRRDHSAVYDPVRDRMVIYGGYAGDSGTPLSDTWELSLDDPPVWTQILPGGVAPPSRMGHSASYDPVRDRMIVYGGRDFWGARSECYTLSLGGAPEWNTLAPTGTGPGARTYHSAVYDPVRDCLVIYGGGNLYEVGQNDTWRLTLSGTPAWVQIAAGGQRPDAGMRWSAFYDPVRDRLVVSCGYDGVLLNYPGQTWALPLGLQGQWNEIEPGGMLLAGRARHTAIYDPLRDRMVIFGGATADGRLNDTWALSLGGTRPVWTPLQPSGTPPSARDRHCAIYDPVRDRMVIFGGFDTACLNDAWALSLGANPAWTQLSPLGFPPPPRTYATAVYDPVRDRMVIFGGSNDTMTLMDTWFLSFAETPGWHAMSRPPSFPGQRYGHSAVYDPTRGRMVIFGGVDSGTRLDDTWALAFADSQWTELAPADTVPDARSGHSAIYDPVRDRMIIVNGNTYDGETHDAWALSFSEPPAWRELAPGGSPPSRRDFQTAIYDPPRDRMIVFAGDGGQGDTRALTWADATGVPEGPGDVTPGAARTALYPTVPNPFNPVTTVRYALREDAIVSLAIYDIRGRVVRTLAAGAASAGEHEVVWDGRDDRGRTVSSGVYFCRLEANGVSDTRKIVMSR